VQKNTLIVVVLCSFVFNLAGVGMAAEVPAQDGKALINPGGEKVPSAKGIGPHFPALRARNSADQDDAKKKAVAVADPGHIDVSGWEERFVAKQKVEADRRADVEDRLIKLEARKPVITKGLLEVVLSFDPHITLVTLILGLAITVATWNVRLKSISDEDE